MLFFKVDNQHFLIISGRLPMPPSKVFPNILSDFTSIYLQPIICSYIERVA